MTENEFVYWRRLRNRSRRQIAGWIQKELNEAKRVASGVQKPDDYMTLERAHKLIAQANDRE